MIRVVAQDEFGNDVSEGIDVRTNLLVDVSMTVVANPPNEPSFRCLCFVDPYGDTIFNQLQLAPLLGDLRLLRDLRRSDEEMDTIRRIEELVKRYQNTRHTYIRLIGD